MAKLKKDRKVASRSRAVAEVPAPVAQKAAAVAPQSIEDLLRSQNDLLSVIAKSSARIMQILDHENRLAGDSHVVADTLGLRRDVDKLLTRNAIESTLLSD